MEWNEISTDVDGQCHHAVGTGGRRYIISRDFYDERTLIMTCITGMGVTMEREVIGDCSDVGAKEGDTVGNLKAFCENHDAWVAELDEQMRRKVN